MLHRHDTWGTGLTSKLAGFHNGWNKVRPAFTGVELIANLPWLHRKTMIESVQTNVISFLGSANVTFDQLIKGAKDEVLDVCLNVDAHLPSPYHGDPRGRPDETFYAPNFNIRVYQDYINFLLERYPWIKWIQVLNEPYFQRGEQLTEHRYEQMVLAANEVCFGKCDVIASVTPHQGRVLDLWTKNPKLDNVIAGLHVHILHRFSDPINYVASLDAVIRETKLRYPGRSLWADETNCYGARHPGNPSGSVGDKADAFRREHNRIIQDLYDEGIIEGVGNGFVGGLEDPCNSEFNVCAAEIDRQGELTIGGLAHVDSAKDLGWWDFDYEVPNEPSEPEKPGNGGDELDKATYAKKLGKIVRKWMTLEIKVNKGNLDGDWEENIKALRSELKSLSDSDDSVNDPLEEDRPEVPPDEFDNLLPIPTQKAIMDFMQMKAAAIRSERDGFYADWRDFQGNHHSGPFPTIIAAVARLREALGWN